MSKIALFRRADGLELEAHEGSEAFKLMSKDGQFERTDKPATEPAEPKTDENPNSEPPAKPIEKMNKTELLAEAEKRGLTLVPDEVTKAQIIAAIQEADTKAAEGSEGEPKS